MKAAITAALVLATMLVSPKAEADPWTLTATGRISSTTGHLDTALLFGAPIESLLGTEYTLTITTDPLLNPVADSTPTLHHRLGGTFPGLMGPGAPYTIAATVNGTTYTQVETNPFWNRQYLMSLSSPTLYDQLDQEAQSSGCSIAYGLCTSSYILAWSPRHPVPVEP
jgi:hypothetical protein